MRPESTRPRERLAQARVLLLFTPDLVGERDPLAVLEAVLPHVDIVQIRPKPLGSTTSAHAPCEARSTFAWTKRVLDLVRSRPRWNVLVTVDDRVDVAAALAAEGCAGVHLGQDDCPVRVARAMLGREALIGLSTHSLEQVAAAEEQDADYLGFGPVQATATKGYSAGLGAEAAWVASLASTKPVFAIGGITHENAGEIARVGRVAVGSAILAAADPARAALELRALLSA